MIEKISAPQYSMKPKQGAPQNVKNCCQLKILLKGARASRGRTRGTISPPEHASPRRKVKNLFFRALRVNVSC